MIFHKSNSFVHTYTVWLDFGSFINNFCHFIADFSYIFADFIIINFIWQVLQLIIVCKCIEQDLSLKCSTWISFIPHLQWKSPSPKQKMGLQKMLGPKNYRPNKILVLQKDIGSGKILSLKKIHDFISYHLLLPLHKF